MTTYVYRPNHALANARGFVEKAWASFDPMHDKRMTVGNEPVSLHVIGDEMEPTRHMGRPGKHYYTSKKKFRDETRARGCIEVGNEALPDNRKPIELDQRQRRDDIRRAFWECQNGQSQALYELRNR